MDKIIFLDIDGVIATADTIEDGSWGLTPSRQKLLGNILEATNAKIVLSSSWRMNTLEETIDYMQEKGFLFCDKLIGVTIRAYQYLEKTSKIHLSIPRGVEIKQYIDTHLKYPWYAYPDRAKEFEEFRMVDDQTRFWKMRSQILGKDYNYVILDDDTDMLLEHAPRFVQCDEHMGLTNELANKAIVILNTELK